MLRLQVLLPTFLLLIFPPSYGSKCVKIEEEEEKLAETDATYTTCCSLDPDVALICCSVPHQYSYSTSSRTTPWPHNNIVGQLEEKKKKT